MSNQLSKARTVTLISGIISLLLLIIKLIIGLRFNNHLILTDALDNGNDLLLMMAAWVGLRIAQRKPDKQFPFGYYKAESITSLLLSLLIIYLSITLLIAGFNDLNNKSVINNSLIITVIISLITSLLLSKYLIDKGRELGSQLLINSGRERLSDALKSLLILSSFILSAIGLMINGYLTIIISLIVLRVGLLSAKDSIMALMDASPNKEVEQQVRSIITNTRGVIKLSSLKLRKAGPFIFGEATIIVNKSLSVNNAHAITKQIEYDTKRLIESLIIHVEPSRSVNGLIAVPVDRNNHNVRASKHFARAKGFLLIRVVNNVIESINYLNNEFSNTKLRAGLSVAKLLTSKGVNILITKEIGEIAFHSLRDELIIIYKANNKPVKELINDLLSNKLIEFTKPTKLK